MNRNVTIGSAVGIVAGLVGVWATIDPWPAIGWTTPNRHQADMRQVEEVMAADVEKILEAIEGLGEKQREQHDEWKCDEYDEELRDRLQEQADGDDSTDLAEDIRRIREKMRELNCQRFEDFG